MRGFKIVCPVGEMTIIARDGSWDLYIDGEFVENYYAPMRAIADLRLHTTGYRPWDDREDIDVDEDLKAWELLA